MSPPFVAKDVAATMATMTADPFVNHVPTMTGGIGADGVADFYAKYCVAHWPADTEIIPVCRTVGKDRVVDELLMSYWDQASALVQIGLLDETLLPVTGVAQAHKVLDKDLPANRLLSR